MSVMSLVQIRSTVRIKDAQSVSKQRQQKNQLDKMENDFREAETPLNFYLSAMQEDVRCYMKDSEAKLTPSEHEGRVNLEVQEQNKIVLNNFLDQFQEKSEDMWSLEKGKMQQEISDLKFLLEEARNKHRSSQSYINDLKFQLRKTRNYRDHNPEQQQIGFIKTENEALKKEVEVMKQEVHAEKQLRLQAEKNLETSTQCLKVQLSDKDTAEFEARKKAEELEKDLLFERSQN